MGIQKYSTQTARINKLAGEIIGHAEPTEVLTGACRNIKMPKNKSETLIVRSWVPYGGTVAAPNTLTLSAAAHIVQEGVTPAADTIVARDVTFILDQYMALYSFTDKQYDLYEDDVEEAMKEQCGERMGLVREMAIKGGMDACTNKFYSGGTTRAAVDGKITEKLCQRIIRSLRGAYSKVLRPEISPSVNIGTSSVEASYVAYCHTDCEQDIRGLPGFIESANYGSKQLISEHELGTWQKLRFVVSADLEAFADAGALISGLGLYSTTGTSADVYPMYVLGKEAFAQVYLRGRSALDPIWLPPDMKSKSDPGGQRGYIGAKFWHTQGVLNNGWMAVAEVAVSDLLE
ncbi:N4-gp56 family major capsid protein [Candidatus Pacearchaeota archaeon]|nr:N4-gp56 family major capsid protein [Candidatus Pacearchaeota archaeon]